jgi:D-arginine dehydrogenase
VEAATGTHRAPVVVNAAGAWADGIGAMAGAAPIGLVAKRRTAIVIDGPPGLDTRALPCVDFAETDAYIKPEAGRLMASPGDAIPDLAQDVRPDEMDIAVLADWIGRETTIEVRRIAQSWAGLRSFVADEGPVVWADPDAPGFFWNAAQGGYGIMMAPTLARVAAAAALGRAMPSDIADAGLAFEDMDRARDAGISPASV